MGGRLFILPAGLTSQDTHLSARKGHGQGSWGGRGGGGGGGGGGRRSGDLQGYRGPLREAREGEVLRGKPAVVSCAEADAPLQRPHSPF